ncbi:DNA topoisomerase IB [Georgenia sp. 10Sc9-8]|uniref:DNA topoisomerase n=1 Tax=Georgenia halotolerans TaxID=3028317 RepID=A0ABT5TUI9_9MICO|nr:DNA topoisomerase IB [Georgenia halotolerans]
MRLRRSRVDSPGLGRRRSGSGFTYLDVDGSPLRDPEQLQRCRDLVIPPAWQEVWICPTPDGHIQAVGTDDAGRRQYLYHPDWRARRDRAKHDHVLDLARALPAARERAAVDLHRRAMPRERALAVAFRLLDLGYFRMGSESYARTNGSYGLATLRKEHVTIGRDGRVWFDYTAKSGQRRRIMIEDEDLLTPLSMLRRRRGGGAELLAYKRGPSWFDLTSTDVNGYLKELLGPEASAKDFRTWHANVLAAVALARVADEARRDGRELSATARRRAVTAAVKEVAAYLGNTPAVCRASYIDPKLLDLFERGETVPAHIARRAYADLPDDPAVADVEVPPSTDDTAESAVLRLLA